MSKLVENMFAENRKMSKEEKSQSKKKMTEAPDKWGLPLDTELDAEADEIRRDAEDRISKRRDSVKADRQRKTKEVLDKLDTRFSEIRYGAPALPGGELPREEFITNDPDLVKGYTVGIAGDLDNPHSNSVFVYVYSDEENDEYVEVGKELNYYQDLDKAVDLANKLVKAVKPEMSHKEVEKIGHQILDGQIESVKKKVNESVASDIYKEIKDKYPDVKIKIFSRDGHAVLRFTNYPGEGATGFGNDPRTEKRDNWKSFLQYVSKKHGGDPEFDMIYPDEMNIWDLKEESVKKKVNEAYLGLNLGKLSPFTKEDWYGYAGVEKLRNEEPLIYRGQEFDIIVGQAYDDKQKAEVVVEMATEGSIDEKDGFVSYDSIEARSGAMSLQKAIRLANQLADKYDNETFNMNDFMEDLENMNFDIQVF